MENPLGRKFCLYRAGKYEFSPSILNVFLVVSLIYWLITNQIRMIDRKIREDIKIDITLKTQQERK